MATYSELSRSNYFLVKDRLAFEEFLSSFGDELDLIRAAGTNRVGFLAAEGIPTKLEPSDGSDPDDAPDVDFMAELAKHLKDGEVAIVVTTGHMKLQYLTGTAVAVNSRGERRVVSLDDIYVQAAELTDRPGDITCAEY